MVVAVGTVIGWRGVALGLALLAIVTAISLSLPSNTSQAVGPSVTWTAKTSMPTGRHDPFVAAAGKMMYVASGATGAAIQLRRLTPSKDGCILAAVLVDSSTILG